MENPISGQHLIIQKVAQDTGGELLEVESVYTVPTPLTATYPLPPPPGGTLRGSCWQAQRPGGRARTNARRGRGPDLTPGVPHEMWAAQAGVRVNWQTRPALKTEAFFETVWGLAKDGKVNDKGVPNLLRVALITREYEDEFRLVSPPWAVQRALFGLLAPVGRLLGYHVRYPYPNGASEKALGREHKRPWLASGARLGEILIATIVGLSVLFLLGRLRRQSRR